MYDEPETQASPVAVATLPETLEDVDDDVLARAEQDPEYFAQLMALLFGASAVWSIDTVDLLAAEGEEGRHIEFKQTARWNVREQRKDKTMEEVIAKTVAGFLNGEGGTLLIGVNDNGEPVGLDADYKLVKPPDRDGYVNWLDTMLQNSLGHAGVHRVRIRFDIVSGYDVCRDWFRG